MKIKQKKVYSDNIIENILINSGVEDINLFLNPDDSTLTKPDNYKNLNHAAKEIIASIATNKNITVLIDSDADGFTSGSITYNVLSDIVESFEATSNISYLTHTTKAHGLTDEVMENIQQIDTDLLIIPDAASNDIDNLLTLDTANYNVVVIDHHNIEDETYIDMIENVTIVNNQRSDNGEVNKHLTGAGMVYKLFEQVYNYIVTSEDKLTPLENYLDLVAIGQIGDASDLTNNEIRYLTFKGLNNIQNPFVKSVLELKNVDLDDKLSPTDMSFSIIPVINAITRVGFKDDRNKLFESFTINKDNNKEVVLEKRKLNKQTRKYETVNFNVLNTEKRANDLAKIKTQQDKYIKNKMNELDKHTDITKGILIYFDHNYSEKESVAGLVATKLANKYERPCLVLSYNEEKDVYFGSARGITKVLDSFKDWCNNLGIFNFAQGHDNAFGVEIPLANLPLLNGAIDKLETNKEHVYEVDKLYENDVDKNVVNLLIKNKDIVGGKVEQITLGYKDMVIPRKNIYIKNQTVTFNIGGCSFVSWGTNDDIIDALQTGFTDNVTVDMVCKPFESSFGGKKTNKLIIEDIEVDDSDNDFFF